MILALRVTVKPALGDHPFVKLNVVAQNRWSLSEGLLAGTGIVSIVTLRLWTTIGRYTTTVLRPFFRDHQRELVPEENFWTLWCKGRLTEADTLTIRLGATPSGLTSAHLQHPPIFLRAWCPSCRPTNSVKALKATSAFGFGRRCYSSQRCYLHSLCTWYNRLIPS